MTKKKNAPQDDENIDAVAAEADLAQELADQNDKYLRVLAEYDNYRKRSQKEREGIYADAQCSTINTFLQILDNLERAEVQPCKDEEYKKGIDLILKQFHELLQKFNVTEIETEMFDPELHNAIMHVEDESLPENAIAQVLCKGYKMGERVLRHAMVQVAN